MQRIALHKFLKSLDGQFPSAFYPDSMIQRLTFAAGLLPLIVSCSSRSTGEYSSAEIRDNVVYHSYRKLDNRTLKKGIIANSHALLEQTPYEFRLELNRVEVGLGLFATLPQGLAWGDAHALSVAGAHDSSLSLESWRNTGFGPLWPDLVRLEVSGRLIAQQEGLRGYAEDTCASAYAARRLSNKHEKPSMWLLPSAGKRDGAIVDFSSHPDWLEAESGDKIPKELALSISRWLAAHAKSGPQPGDTLKLRGKSVLILDRNKQLWELRELAEPALAPFSSLDAPASACARYDAWARAMEALAPQGFRNSVETCASEGDRSFVLARVSFRREALPSHFATPAQLQSHVRATCEALADFHAVSLNEAALRHWSLALQSEGPLRTRLRELSEEVLKTYQEAYRRILRDNE